MAQRELERRIERFFGDDRGRTDGRTPKGENGNGREERRRKEVTFNIVADDEGGNGRKGDTHTIKFTS